MAEATPAPIYLTVLVSACAQLGLYMSLAPEQKLTFPLGGPAAQAAFEQGLSGFEARAFRGLGILTSTPYEMSDGARYPLPHIHVMPQDWSGAEQ